MTQAEVQAPSTGRFPALAAVICAHTLLAKANLTAKAGSQWEGSAKFLGKGVTMGRVEN